MLVPMKAANSAPLSQPTAAAPQSSAAAGGGGGVSLTPAVGRQVAGAANRRRHGRDRRCQAPPWKSSQHAQDEGDRDDENSPG